MRFSGFPLRPLLLACLCAFTSSSKLAAESYTVTPLQFDQGWNLIGIQSSGEVVILDGYNFEYETFLNGAKISESLTAPAASSFDNGTACAPSAPAGFEVFAARCNGSYQAIDGWNFATNPDQHIPGLYTGSVLANDLVTYGGGGLLFLNSSGTLTWDDAFSDTIYEATPVTTTPEPTSLTLLATGVLTLAGTVRRRRRTV